MDSNTTSSTNFYTFLKQREEKPKQKQKKNKQTNNKNTMKILDIPFFCEIIANIKY